MTTTAVNFDDIIGDDDARSVDYSESRGTAREETKEVAPAIAARESRTVLWLKLLLLFVLVLAATLAALLVYFYASTQETTAFEEQFAEFSNKVLESIGSTFETTLGAMDVLSVGILSHARSSNQSWPTVYTPDFAYRAAKIRPLSKAISIGQVMIVEPEDREKWEAYTLFAGDEEYLSTVDVMENDPNYYGPVLTDYELYGTIHGDFGDINETRVTMPSWSWYPSVPLWYPPHNYDYASVSNPKAINNTLVNGVVTFSEIYMLPDPNNAVEVEETEIWAEYYADFVGPDENPNEPMSEFYVPIIDNNLTLFGENVETKDNVVSILIGTIYWRDMFKDMLPEGTNGLMIVTESECAPTFSYMLNGPKAEYLGRGDFHDERFNSLGIHNEGYGIRLSQYTGPSVDEDFCKVTFHLYPSTNLESYYVSNDPIIFAVVAVAIFIFTSMIFVLYDCSVAKRQKVVLASAEKSSAVVSSLFPEAVRDRLYDAMNEDKTSATASSSADKKKEFLSHNNEQKLETTGVEIKPYAGRPNCDLYPNTTIFFADIAGFTKWSSTRSPSEVFTLLEALYGAFDKLAKKRGVFKVETIGDCYVAVTGLPTPRKSHALAMCRFADDCLVAASRILKSLENELGEGTSDLALRVGIHSGPTTAGVLRGDKGRFQLFGDTVNTAARMESNGQPGRIHVSQETADLLIHAGQGHWVQKREDVITAKGKGTLQTYWAKPTGADTQTEFTAGGSTDESTVGESD